MQTGISADNCHFAFMACSVTKSIAKIVEYPHEQMTSYASNLKLYRNTQFPKGFWIILKSRNKMYEF